MSPRWCSADQLPDWLAATPYTTRAWMLAWRGVRTEPVADSRFLLVHDGTGHATVAPFYLIDGAGSPAWGAFQSEAGLGDIWGGRPVVYGPSPYATYGLDLVSPAHIQAIVAAGVAWAREAGAVAAVFPGLRDPWAWTDAAGGIAVRTTASHQAAVCGSVEAFQASISLAGPRREFGRQWRRGTDAGLRVAVLHGAEMLPLLRAFTRLAAAASARHGTSLYGLDVFGAVAQVPGAVLLAAEHGPELAGGFLCLRHGGTLYLWAAGLDYATHRELHTYGWLFAESVAYAAANGLIMIDAGRGNYDYKRRLGFAQIPLWSVCHLVSPDRELAGSLAEMGRRIAARAAVESSSHTAQALIPR